MPSMMEALGLSHMTLNDRLALLGELWDSLTTEPDAVPLTAAQRADLDRRLAALDADPTAGSSWEVVKARLLDQP